MTPLLSPHAASFFGPVRANGWGGVPWDKAEKHTSGLKGMWGGAVCCFDSAIIFTADTDIDSDGPGGSRAVDPDWQRSTSLTTAGGASCDSRRFPGVVIPPSFGPLYNVHKGDFGLCCYNGRVRAFQVYDSGPANKVGEISLYLGRQLLIIPPSQSDHIASTCGNKVEDLTTIIFRRSGPGHALDPNLIAESTEHLWQVFTGQASPRHGVVYKRGTCLIR